MNDYLTAEQIAAGTGLAVGSVYRLASLHRWRRTNCKPRGYRAADVLATVAAREVDNSPPAAKDDPRSWVQCSPGQATAGSAA